ncbi:hypothetical protein C8Q73DRAFT_714078 [Cubamyces lactineus]|nr:hypothetical protein C8Q73DRAFT_714078 [Cubamyces lactineus]
MAPPKQLSVDYPHCADAGRSLLELVPRKPTRLSILNAAAFIRGFVAQGILTRFVVESTTDSGEYSFCTFFADAPLTRLSIDTEGFSTVGLEPSFRLLRHLATIKVDFESVEALQQLLDALASSPSSPPSPTSTSSTHPGGMPSDTDDTRDIVVPQLRTVKLETFPWHPELLSGIEQCL